MKILLTILVTSFTLAVGLAQDKDMEIRFFNERDKIKESRIKEITESVYQEWKKECSRDSAKLRLRYSFDNGGNLIQVDYYHTKDELYKTIKYKRNANGGFYEKTDIYYDSTGSVSGTNNWEFEFNDKGRPVIERCRRDTAVLLTNVLSYDKRGNYIKQVRNGFWEWYFKYNKKGKLTESNECVRYSDSTRCFNFTKYTYKDGLLVAEAKYDPRVDTIWKTISYTYDNENNLVEILDPMKFTSKPMDGPEEKIPEIISFTYNEKNNCLSKSLSRRDEKPFRCYYYAYKYY